MAASEGKIKLASLGQLTHNPIRSTMDRLSADANPEKEVIPLNIGDPTKFGNFKPPAAGLEQLGLRIDDCTANGYTHSAGLPAARAAISSAFTSEAAPVTADDVIIASGGSGAIDIALSALVDAGTNVLVPRPGFPLYGTIAAGYGGEVRYFDLLPERGWEADLDQVASLIDDKTVCLCINNPSNPCGSVFSEEHLRALVGLAADAGVPILSDEIYHGMVFDETTPYVPASHVAGDTVPVITVGGLAKRFMVPGWRIGWLLVHDATPNQVLSEVRAGMMILTQRIIGANTLCQSTIPAMLSVGPEYHKDNLDRLAAQATFFAGALEEVPGLNPVTPQGAMYLMIRIDVDAFDETITDDITFTERLLAEESVFVLPGQCFFMPNYFRVVFVAPVEKLEVAAARISEFCARHTV